MNSAMRRTVQLLLTLAGLVTLAGLTVSPLLLSNARAGDADGKCYSDSECGGGKCNSGKCTTAGGYCYSDSECPGGRCNSGKCSTHKP